MIYEFLVCLLGIYYLVRTLKGKEFFSKSNLVFFYWNFVSKSKLG